MQKVITSFRKKYPPLVIYLTDILELIQLFKEHDVPATIQINNYIIEDINEIKSIKEKITYLEIASSKLPLISLTLSKDEARVYIADEDNLKLLGVAEKIGKILSKRRRFILYVFGSDWHYLFTIVFTLMVYFIYPSSNKTLKLLIALAVYLVLSPFYPIIYLKRYTQFVNEKGIPLLEYLGKNKNQIIWDIIKIVISLIGGIIIGMWIKK